MRACPAARLGRDIPVDDHLETGRRAGGFEHRGGVLRGGDDRDLGAALGQLVEQWTDPGYGCTPSSRTAREEHVLAIAQPTHGFHFRAVGRVAVGELDVAGGEE